jgi:hypothetical protein
MVERRGAEFTPDAGTIDHPVAITAAPAERSSFWMPMARSLERMEADCHFQQDENREVAVFQTMRGSGGLYQDSV